MKHCLETLDFCSLECNVQSATSITMPARCYFYGVLSVFDCQYILYKMRKCRFALESRASSIHSDLKVLCCFMLAAKTRGWEQLCCCVKPQKGTQERSTPEKCFWFVIVDLFVKIRPPILFFLNIFFCFLDSLAWFFCLCVLVYLTNIKTNKLLMFLRCRSVSYRLTCVRCILESVAIYPSPLRDD